MPRLFLIRHGEPSAVWGDAEPDPGLSEAGFRQAELAANRLASEGPLAVVCSPMRRCRETAAPYADRVGARLTIEPRVSEVAAPAGVGDRRLWLQQHFPWRTPGQVRSWSTLAPALRAWREEVLAGVAAIDIDAAVFTHFIAINAIVGAALGKSETIVCKPGYASVTELLLTPEGLRLVALGESMTEGDVR